MPNLNRVMLMGNLTRDPELRYTPNNHAVCQIGLAINRHWKDPATGEKKEEVAFINCEAWGRTGEVINQYLRKGRPIYVEGRLKYDQWQDKDGNARSALRVVVESFEFIDSKGGGGGGEGDGGGGGERFERGGNQGSYNRPPAQGNRPQQQSRPNNAPASSQAPTQAPMQAMEPHHPVDDENIPF